MERRPYPKRPVGLPPGPPHYLDGPISIRERRAEVVWAVVVVVLWAWMEGALVTRFIGLVGA